MRQPRKRTYNDSSSFKQTTKKKTSKKERNLYYRTRSQINKITKYMPSTLILVLVSL